MCEFSQERTAAMTPEHFERAYQVFVAALELAPEERPEFVRKACEGDEELREEVEDLLRADSEERAGDIPALPEETITTPSGQRAVTPGMVLKGRYQIAHRLGKGGFSFVYLAHDAHLLNRQVVIKVLRTKQRWFRRKFAHECKALARIHHPGVVGVLDQGKTPDGTPFLVMEFVEGASLKSIIPAGGMELDRAAPLLRHMGEALQAVHEQGVYHRDLKPTNVMVRNLGRGQEMPVIIDFGIATVRESPQGVLRRTRVVGTEPYMAPEQYVGRPEAASDIFALGVIAWELLAGRLPSHSRSTHPPNIDFLRELDELHHLRPDVPEAAVTAIRKALAIEPAERFATATDFGDELAQALRTPSAAPPTVPEQQRVMFITKGPINPESPLFVGRAKELEKMESWLRQADCVGAVLGARQTGKTSLLLKLRHRFRDKHAFAYVDFQVVEGASVAECFNFIADQIRSQLAHGKAFSLPSTTTEFMAFLGQVTAVIRSPRIVILLDEIGALPLATTLKLSSAVRAAFTNRLVKPELARCMFLLAGASDMLEVATGRNSPLRNVTESIYLGDFSLSETEELLDRGSEETSAPFPPDIRRSLYNWTSGHPYWTQLLGTTVSSQNEYLTSGSISRLVEELIRTEDKNLPHIFQLLQADDNQWKILELLLDGAPISFSRANSTVARLELIGVLKNENGRCAIRNNIYREALQKLQVRELHAPEHNLRVLTRRIFASADINSLLHDVIDHIQQAFQIGSTVAFLKAPSGALVPEAHMAVPAGNLEQVRFEPGCHLLKVPDVVFSPAVTYLPEAEKKQLHRIGCSVIVQLRARGEALGFLAVGAKLSGVNYDSRDMELLEAIGDQVSAAIDRTRLRAIEDDAKLAYDIQRGLLPKKLPEIPGFEIAGTWLPAQLVSGDYYDVLKLSDSRFALCIADVAGKGMAAALLMANLQAAVKALSSETCPPKDLCAEVNRLICSNITPGKFITFFYALLDAQSRQLTYANAGHNAPILLRSSGEVLRLSEGGALLGIFPEWSYRQADLALAPGDVLLAFTDGVNEAQSVKGEEYGENRLIELISANAQDSAANLQKLILSAISDFTNLHFHDDVTIITLKFC
jgi:serine/threonine protein kinase